MSQKSFCSAHSNTLEFFEFTPEIKKDWDQFVLSHPNGSVHQISAWKDFQERVPGRGQVLGFGVKKSGSIIATTWCVKMEIGKIGKHWYYSARGPVVDFETDLDAYQCMVAEVQKILKKEGGIFWRMDPYWNKSQKTLASGMGLALKSATQDYQPTDTRMVDLLASEDDILAQMKQRGRRFIKKSAKVGIEVETIEQSALCEKDLNDYFALNLETTERDGFAGHGIDYYRHFLQQLSDHAVLFFATYEGKRLAAAISTFCGEKSIYYFGASTSDRELAKLNAPSLLQWEMMKYAKARGCSTYDFLGIAPEGEKNHPYVGITQFKDGFGGYRATYARGAEVVLRPFWYMVYRALKLLR